MLLCYKFNGGIWPDGTSVWLVRSVTVHSLRMKLFYIVAVNKQTKTSPHKFHQVSFRSLHGCVSRIEITFWAVSFNCQIHWSPGYNLVSVKIWKNNSKSIAWNTKAFHLYVYNLFFYSWYIKILGVNGRK